MTPSGNPSHSLLNPPQATTPNGASSCMFGNFATSTNKSMVGGLTAAQSVTAAQFQQHVTFMNKYQQRLIDTLNPILDQSPLSSKELERGDFLTSDYFKKLF